MHILHSEKKDVYAGQYEKALGYIAWPSAARLPDGNLAIAASGFRLDHICPFGKGLLFVSCDEGKSWSDPRAIFDTQLDDRDCGICMFAGKRVIVTSFNNSLDFQRNSNKYRLMSEQEETRAKGRLIDAYLDYAQLFLKNKETPHSNYRISNDGGLHFSDIRHCPVSAPHGPIADENGRLIYIGHRFSLFEDPESAKSDVQCYALDENDCFTHLGDIPNIFDEKGKCMSCEPHAVALGNGRILVHIRVQRWGENSLFTIYQSESLDGGKTFSLPRQILRDRGGSPPHLLRHSSGVLICSYGYREKPYGIRLMMSRNEGKTWDSDYILEQEAENGDLGYPASVELKDGSLMTVYYQKTGGQAQLFTRFWKMPF